jgi:hypothetical protein
VTSLRHHLLCCAVRATGQLAHHRAANASPELISEHAGIGTKAAVKYSDHMPSRLGSAREVMSQLNQKLRRKQG